MCLHFLYQNYEYLLEFSVIIICFVYSYRTIDISNTNPVGFVVWYAPFGMIIGGWEENSLIEFYLGHIPYTEFEEKNTEY